MHKSHLSNEIDAIGMPYLQAHDFVTFFSVSLKFCPLNVNKFDTLESTELVNAARQVPENEVVVN